MYSDVACLGELQSPHKSIVVGTTTMTTKLGQPSFHNNNGVGEFLGIGCPPQVNCGDHNNSGTKFGQSSFQSFPQ
jgi:hypothetical protein